MRLQDHVEVELKLSVIGAQPDAVLDQVAQLEAIGPLSLGPPTDHRLHDIYWDSPDGGLRSRRLSLRLRQIDERRVFTAKGGTSSHAGLFRRNELEVPATLENWQQIRRIFRDEGVDLREDDRGTDPADWLAASGLVVTQDRATQRTVRYGFAGGTAPVAELALDRTQFRFGEVIRKYWEIEVEQIQPGVSLEGLGEQLLRQFPGQLELSTMGKYSRGLMLERELRAAGRI